MLDVSGIQEIIATNFFGGNGTVAGIVIYTVVLAVVLAISRKLTTALLVSLPITFVFAQLNVLSTDMMVLLIIVAVLGLAMSTRQIWKDS